MTVLADSDAVYDPARQFAQHQAILTIVQQQVAGPTVKQFSWLDLACGKGQILAHLEENIGAASCAKIRYFGYDVQPHFTQTAERLAENISIKEACFKHGDLVDFSRMYADEKSFDLITLTNAVHEVNPATLATIVVCAINRLAPKGRFFVYDMERLPSPELGAVTWTRNEIHEIVSAMLTSLGVHGYDPFPGQWPHRQCKGWNLHLEREHLGVTHKQLVARTAQAIEVTKEKIRALVEVKLRMCESSLESLTKYRSETATESADEMILLHQFWALSRAQRTFA